MILENTEIVSSKPQQPLEQNNERTKQKNEQAPSITKFKDQMADRITD